MKASKAMLLPLMLAVILGQSPQPEMKKHLEPQLQQLSRTGQSYRFLDDYTIEVYDSLNGYKRTKTLHEPDETAIRTWASQRDIPVIEIDPTLVDTSQWTGWYDFWTTVPVSNGTANLPTQVRDFDGNGFPEVYGLFGWIGSRENRVFEVYPNGSSIQRHIYDPAPAGSTQILDLDRNGLWEVVFVLGPTTYVYEQPTSTSLPTELKFAFNKYNPNAAYLSREIMAYMDSDSLIDFVHRGTDSTVSQYYLAYVSEYNPSIPNFEKTWFVLPPPHGSWDGFDVGDYDGDGRMEVLISYIFGNLLVYEKTGDNTYAGTFEDSLPLVNMFYQISGDVDRDGKREFFVAATMSDGNWTVMYEADSNNHYSPLIVLHLLSGGTLDDPTYFTDDLDNDGNVELVILSGGYLYVFKSNANDMYYLWYLKRGPASFSLNFHDMDGDGIKDILWTRVQDDQWISNIYKGSPLVSVGPEPRELPERVELMQNYPNPFNPSTAILYSLSSQERDGVRSHVTLKVYDVLGREVATLVNQTMEAGTHTVQWDASTSPSGVYFYRLETSASTITKKMLLVR
jgi:hypothetical protein